MVVQKASNWLVGAILAAIVAAGVSPNIALQFFSALTASCGIGALISRVLSQNELAQLEYNINAAAELKIQDFKTKYDIKLHKLQGQVNLVERDKEEDARREALLQEQEAELQELRQQVEALRAANAMFQDRWYQAQQEATAELEQMKAEHEQRVQEEIKKGLGERIAKIRERIYKTEYLPKLTKYVQKQVDRQNALKAEMQAQQEQATLTVDRFKGLAVQLKDRCVDATDSLEQWIEEQERWKEEQLEKVAFVISAIQAQHEQEVERLQAQIQHFLQPKRLAATSKAAIVANEIASWYLQRNIVIDVEDAKSWTTKDEIWVKTRGMGLKPLKELSEQLWEDFELAQEPEFDIEQGCVKITVFNEEPLDPSVTYKALKSADETIAKHVEASDGIAFKIFRAEDKLRAFIKNSERLHFLINGDSGAGKDALMNNFINLVYQVMAENGEEVEVVVIDPKYPNDSPIVVNGEVVKPKYRGINDPDGDESLWQENDTLAGLMALQNEVYRRLAIATEYADKDLPMPPFKPIIFAISELEQAIAVYEKVASNAVKTGARLGRSLKIAIVANAQSPNAAAYKWMIADLNNFATAYLRENSWKGIDERIKTAEQRKPLKRAVGWLEKNSEGRDRHDPERFYGTFKLPGEPMFAAFLPEPNAFSGLNGLPEAGEPAEQTLEAAVTQMDEDTTPEPFSLAEMPVFETAADQLLNAVEERKQQLSPLLPEPEPEPDERLLGLTLQARAIHDTYQRLGLAGHKVTARWAQRKAMKARDLRTMKAAQILEAFQELASAGYGTVDSDSKSWCMGELPAGEQQKLLKGDEKADAVREAVR